MDFDFDLDMDMDMDLYDSPFDTSPVLNGQLFPEEDELDGQVIEEMEEEYARLSRQREDLLAAGQTKQARDIELYLRELEEMMGDFSQPFN